MADQIIEIADSSVIVIKNGAAQIRLSFNAQGVIDAYSSGVINLYTPVNEQDLLVRIPQIGEEVIDGWIYGGISQITNTPLFTAPADWSVKLAWDEAIYGAAHLEKGLGYKASNQRTEEKLREAIEKGKHDHGVRLPTEDELNQNLIANHEKIGGFQKSTVDESKWYWSSTESNGLYAHAQRLNANGGTLRSEHQKSTPSILRFVKT